MFSTQVGVWFCPIARGHHPLVRTLVDNEGLARTSHHLCLKCSGGPEPEPRHQLTHSVSAPLRRFVGQESHKQSRDRLQLFASS